MIRPTPRLLRIATAGLLVSLAGVWWPSLLAVGAMFAVPAILLELMGLDYKSPTVAVRAPSRVSVGDTLEATVGAMTRWQDWFGLRMQLETDAGLEPLHEVYEPRVQARRSHRFTVELKAKRRGPAEIRAVWVRVTGSLGLLEAVHRVEVEATTRVSPNLAAVRQLSAALHATGSHGGSVSVVTTGAGTEFDELRPYIAGMDSRSIDWKSSARHRELRVRRYRQEQNQQLVLMVDNHAFEGTDHAVHAGLALARTALAQGDRVALQLFGAEPVAFVPFGHGARHLQRLLTALGDAAPETVPSNPVHAAHALSVRLRRRSMVVLFTDAGDPVRGELVGEAARILQAKHRVIVVALREHEELPCPETLEDVAQALLQRNLAAERTRATERIRSGGVSVIAADPRSVSRTLLQRYRTSKRRVG